MTKQEPDIVLKPAEGPIVGIIPGLRGKEAVTQVINQLLRRNCGGGRR